QPVVRSCCAALKLLGLLALLACLLEPLWSSQRARPGANYFAVVADTSEGMSIQDSGSTRTRGEELSALLTSEQSAWPRKLEEDFQVRRYSFDARLQSLRGFAGLEYNGRASAIGGALETLS